MRVALLIPHSDRSMAGVAVGIGFWTGRGGVVGEGVGRAEGDTGGDGLPIHRTRLLSGQGLSGARLTHGLLPR